MSEHIKLTREILEKLQTHARLIKKENISLRTKKGHLVPEAHASLPLMRGEFFFRSSQSISSSQCCHFTGMPVFGYSKGRVVLFKVVFYR